MHGVAANTHFFSTGACSVAGPGRPTNEDATLRGPHWFAVADGMGGQRAGDIASELAVARLRSEPPAHSPSAVRMVVGQVDVAVRRRAREIGAVGMGTTIVGLTAVGESLVVFHVGDSRCYHLVDGRLTLVTRDHSHVQELVDAGALTPDEARRHRLRNVITRALGADGGDGADVSVVGPPYGRFLLCTDGITAILEPRSIGRVMSSGGDAQATADRLVELAVRAGARDDVTALVVDHANAPCAPIG